MSYLQSLLSAGNASNCSARSFITCVMCELSGSASAGVCSRACLHGRLHLQAKGVLRGDLHGLLWGLSSFLMARRALLPFIQDGNKGCGGRLRCRTLSPYSGTHLPSDQQPSQPSLPYISNGLPEG